MAHKEARLSYDALLYIHIISYLFHKSGLNRMIYEVGQTQDDLDKNVTWMNQPGFNTELCGQLINIHNQL